MGCASSAPRVGPPVGADGLPTEEADEFRPRKRSFLEPEFIRSRAPSELLGFNRSRQSSGNLEFNRSRQPSGGWLRQERYQSPELDTVRRTARDEGYREIFYNENSRVISFQRGDVRINVYYTTGTVGTAERATPIGSATTRASSPCPSARLAAPARAAPSLPPPFVNKRFGCLRAT